MAKITKEGWVSGVYHQPAPTTDCPVVEIGGPVTTCSANETLRQALVLHHLRLAQAVEIKQRYVLECQVCGEVMEIHHWERLAGHCYVCGISWKASAPVFLVLLSESVPVPEDEG